MKLTSALLVVSALAIAGCGDSAEETAMEKQIERATGNKAQVEMSESGMKIQGSDESGSFSMTTGDAARIPDDFPQDVHIFQPSRPLIAMQIAEGWNLSLETERAVADVIAAYQQNMSSSGWTIQSSMNMGPQSVIVFEKDGRVANVMAMPAEGVTRITLSVGSGG